MLMFKALKKRVISLLWVGQAASAIGDEIYRVALIWMAVGYVGEKAGYLGAGQAGIFLLFSLIGGFWSDRWNVFKTLIWVDVLRGAIVLIPVFLMKTRFESLTMLWVVALSLSALSAFFDPAIQTLLPRIAESKEILQATTGLMSTTFRLARVIAPSLIGVFSSFLPMIQFFSLDALSFLISTLSISMLARHAGRERGMRKVATNTFRREMVDSFRLGFRSPEMKLMMITKTFCAGAWNLAYSLGLALLVRQLVPNSVTAFGLVLSAYGVGNLGAALVLGNLPRVRVLALTYSGYLISGVGFLLMALSPNVGWLMLTSAIAAIGGVVNDIPSIDLIQMRYSIEEIPKIFRLKMVLETGSTLVGMLLSPMLFAQFNAARVIGFCGLLTAAFGVYGLLNSPPERGEVIA